MTGDELYNEIRTILDKYLSESEPLPPPINWVFTTTYQPSESEAPKKKIVITDAGTKGTVDRPNKRCNITGIIMNEGDEKLLVTLPKYVPAEVFESYPHLCRGGDLRENVIPAALNAFYAYLVSTYPNLFELKLRGSK